MPEQGPRLQSKQKIICYGFDDKKLSNRTHTRFPCTETALRARGTAVRGWAERLLLDAGAKNDVMVPLFVGLFEVELELAVDAEARAKAASLHLQIW